MFENQIKSFFTKQNNQKKFISSSRDFYIYAGFILLVVLTSSIWSGLALYNSQKSALSQKLISESQLIDTNFNNYLNYVSHIAEDKGHKIALRKGNLNYTADLFKRNFFFPVTKLGLKRKAFLWPNFSWVDSKRNVLVKSEIGVLKNPEKISDAKHLYNSATNSWQLHLSDPYYDSNTDKVFIDASLGVSDLKTEEYIGAILTRFNLEKLVEATRSGLKEETKFIILDEEMKIIAESDKKEINDDDFFIKGLSKTNFNPDPQMLEDGLKYDNNIYKVYRKSSDYPFIILTGYNSHSFNKQFLLDFVGRFISLFGAAFFVAIILFFQRQKIIKEEKQNQKLLEEKNLELTILNSKLGHQNDLAKKSKESREKFLFESRKDIIEDAIVKITKDISTLLDYEEQKIAMSKPTAIDLNKKILASCAKILSYVSDNLDLSYVSVEKIINDAIAMAHYDANINNVELSFKIEKDVENIYIDERSIKHVIVTLINYAMEDRKANLQNPFVKITVRNIFDNEKKFLEVIFEDNGHGISEEVRKSFNQGEKKEDNISLSLSSIRSILSSHKASFEIKNKMGSGSVMVIKIPYMNNSNQEKDETGEMTNIINLFPKK